MFPQLPFALGTLKQTGAGGVSDMIGKSFFSKEGYEYRVYRISADLVNNAFADGELAVFKSDGIVTNDVSDAEDSTNPRAAGIAIGALPESEGATDATIFYGLFMKRGVKTGVSAAASIAIGDGLCTSLVGGGTPVDGQVQRLPKANDSDSTLLANLTSGFVGVAISATSSSTIKAAIDIKN